MEELINKPKKWNLSQAFLKALTSAKKLHWRATIFAERLPMTVSALKHDRDIITIKSAESLKTILIWRKSTKMNRNKNLLMLCYFWKKLSKFSNTLEKVFRFVSLCEINCIKIEAISLVLNLSIDSLCFI